MYVCVCERVCVCVGGGTVLGFCVVVFRGPRDTFQFHFLFGDGKEVPTVAAATQPQSSLPCFYPQTPSPHIRHGTTPCEPLQKSKLDVRNSEAALGVDSK